MTKLKEGLAIGARSMPGNPCGVYALHGDLVQTEILSEVKPLMASFDLSYRDVEVDRTQIWKSSYRRGIRRGLLAMIGEKRTHKPFRRPIRITQARQADATKRQLGLAHPRSPNAGLALKA